MNIFLLSLAIIGIITLNLTNGQVIQPSSCLEALQCFFTNYMNYQNILRNCTLQISDCDGDCMEQLDLFNICSSQKCNCKSISDTFNWSCIDNCRDQSQNKNFANLVKCIYEPCRPFIYNWTYFFIILGLLLFILVSLGVGFCVYRYRQKRGRSGILSTVDYSIIN